MARSIIGRPISTRHMRHMPDRFHLGVVAKDRDIDTDLFGGIHDQGPFRDR